MTDFATLDQNQPDIPTQPSTTGNNALGLSNPDSILSGTMRGTQAVGTDGAFIDSANNRILIQNPIDGSTIGLGTIPGSATKEFGFFSLNASGNVTMKNVNGVESFYDNNGNLIQKIENGTTSVYDPSHGYANVTQSGLLPDGSGGFVVAKPGLNVDDIFS